MLRSVATAMTTANNHRDGHRASRGLVGVFALCVAAAPALVGFRPFSPVQSVCPNCAEKGDKIHLTKGGVVVATIVAKNQDGYIANRFGELRLIQTPEIAKVEWASGAEPRGLDGYDQIVLKGPNQVILHGKLVSVEPGKPLALNSVKNQLYTVTADQVLVYYQRGTRKAPPREPTPPAQP